MDLLLTSLYATIATIIVISPFIIHKYKKSKKRYMVYNSPPRSHKRPALSIVREKPVGR